MYKKQVLHSVQVQFPGADLSARPTYKPMSFYVKGGLDIDGDALNMNAQTDFDSDDDTAGFECSVDGTCNPRVSAFDVIEQAGVQSYEKYKTELARSKEQQQQQQQQTE